MADIEDVSATLASTIAGLINTNGAPVPVTVAPGWPLANDLNALIIEGKAHVSVYPQPGVTSNVTRFRKEWKEVSRVPLTLTATINDPFTITFGGSVTLPANIAVRFLNNDYVYSCVDGDTPASVAAGLAALINDSFGLSFGAGMVMAFPLASPASIISTAAGAVLTIARGDPNMRVAIVGEGLMIRETARERQGFQITIWAPSQAIRVALSKAFEAALLSYDRLALPDGTDGILTYQRSMVSDNSELEGLYRRDIIVMVEYGITETAPAWTVVSARALIEGSQVVVL